MRGESLEVREERGIRNYKDLIVYRKGFELAVKAHRLTKTFPKHERYELGSQIRRAAVSIPANIAEGYGRKKSAAEFKHFLRNALGTCNEVCVLLDIARELNYLDTDDKLKYLVEYDILGKQIYKLIETWQ